MKLQKIQTTDEIDKMLEDLFKELDLACGRCGNSCIIREKKGNHYKRCTFKLCKKEESTFKNTIFYYKHLNKHQIVYILRMWFSKVPVLAISELLDISSKTISKYLKKALAFIEERYLLKLKTIGGPGIIVEIDESKFGRRKYYRGHRVDGVWVLGMVERTPKRRIVLIPVPDRKSDTLLKIIKKYVHPDSLIYTDCWKGYICLKNEFASHKTVNHSIAFVAFINNVHTNTIEGNWAGIKQNLHVQLRTKDRIMLYA